MPAAVPEALVHAPARRGLESLSRLGPEEHELLRLVAEGLETTDICRMLFLPERTAKRKVAALLRKLGVSNRIQAAALAGQCGLLDQPA